MKLPRFKSQFALAALLLLALEPAHAFYDPGPQRWLNRDLIGESGGIHLYGFVGNDPADRLDKYGLQIVIPIPGPKPRPIPPGPMPIPRPIDRGPRPGPGNPRSPSQPSTKPLSFPLPLPVPRLCFREASPVPTNPDCSWTGETQEPVPGFKECVYECADGSIVYKVPGLSGCKDVVKKNDPYIPPY